MYPKKSYPYKYSIITYTTSEGLPQSTVTSLVQDRYGYIWVGTQSGLGIFNGKDFKVIALENGLPSVEIQSIEVNMNKDSEIVGYVGTKNGLAIINRSNYRIRKLLVGKSINALYYSNNDKTLYIAVKNKIYSFTKGKLSKFKLFDESFDISKIVIYNKKLYVIFKSQEIMAEIDICDLKVKNINFFEEIYSLRTYKNKLYIGGETKLFSFNEKSKKSVVLTLENSYFKIIDFGIDKSGKLWVATEKEGILVYKNFMRNKTDFVCIGKRNGLSTDYLRCLLVDKENNIFVGAYYCLNQINSDFFAMYETDSLFPGMIIFSFFEDKENNRILMGGDGGIIELKDGNITAHKSSVFFKYKSIRSIEKIGEKIFVALKNGGIYRLEKDKAVMIDKNISVLHSCFYKNIVYYATKDGVYKFDGKNLTKIFQSDKYVWSISVYDENSLLLGTERGVKMLRNEKYVNSVFEKEVKKDIVNHILVVNKDEVYVASKGLCVFKKGEIFYFSKDNGLLSNDIWSLVKDDYENLWISTSKALSRLDKQGNIFHYNKSTGLIGNEGGVHACLKTDKFIFISLVCSFIKIDNKKEWYSSTDPMIYIKRVEINGKDYYLNDHETLYLKYSQNNIKFYFEGVSTCKQTDFLYKTKLSPFDSDWAKPTKYENVNYTNVSPGEYEFMVIGNNRGKYGKWKSAKPLKIVIEKPFWLRIWFILLALMLMILFIKAIFRFRLRNLEKRKRELENIVKERTAEIERQNKKLQDLSITDALTGFKNRRFLKQKIKEEIALLRKRSKVREKGELKRKNEETQKELVVYMIDVDFFKKVNDRYGHSAGDDILKEIARRLERVIRSGDIIIRFGGEEFLLVCKQGVDVDSMLLAKRINKEVGSTPFKINDKISISKTVSIGFAHFPFILNDFDAISWSQTVAIADTALYLAKSKGRNCCVGVEALDLSNQEDVSDILDDMQKSIKKGLVEISFYKGGI